VNWKSSLQRMKVRRKPTLGRNLLHASLPLLG
jgi:hypothetical protein